MCLYMSWMLSRIKYVGHLTRFSSGSSFQKKLVIGLKKVNITGYNIDRYPTMPLINTLFFTSYVVFVWNASRDPLSLSFYLSGSTFIEILPELCVHTAWDRQQVDVSSDRLVVFLPWGLIFRDTGCYVLVKTCNRSLFWELIGVWDEISTFSTDGMGEIERSGAHHGVSTSANRFSISLCSVCDLFSPHMQSAANELNVLRMTSASASLWWCVKMSPIFFEWNGADWKGTITTRTYGFVRSWVGAEKDDKKSRSWRRDCRPMEDTCELYNQ